MKKMIFNMVALFGIVLTAFGVLVVDDSAIEAPLILTTIILSYYLGHPMSHLEEEK